MSGEKVNARVKVIFPDDLCDLGLIGATIREVGISYDALIGNECQDIQRVLLTKQSQNSPRILGLNIFRVLNACSGLNLSKRSNVKIN